MNTFPVGWCEANGYKLLAPHKNTVQRKRKVAIVQPEKQIIAEVPIEKIQNPYRLPQTDRMGTVNGRYNCPMLFINHRCFSGPHLNKGRLAELPQSVGPGKCVLVLKEILRMVVNSAYKPRSILRELQLVDDPRWNFQEENLKAKYRGKTYRATVKIVRTSDQVPDFCRKVCAKLECCPNLFSPLPVTENCPENCSSHTKTKYAYYYGKRRKVIKSSPSEESTYSLESRHNLSEGGKMRKPILTLKRSCPSAADLHRAGSSEESDEEEADTPWSEEINPELQDDLTDASSEEMSLAIPVSTMKLRSSRGSIHVARPKSDGHAPKALSFLRAQSERTRQALFIRLFWDVLRASQLG
ncbi:scm-like with four MBT domains protein 2 [Crotalus adamanteus]|uniref:Scm-like with four MBT domains protein 2 n=1 Tax=Crotalus adamanteus TaxID=8729 RepID=A0AAW1BEY9_CROAD